MSTPTKVPDVAVYAGDTLVFPTYELADEDDVLLDLSSWTWAAQWRKSTKSTDEIPLTVDFSQANIGTFKISASAAQTQAMGSSGVWDLQGTKAGVVETFLVGETTYTSDVTRV